MQDEIKVAKAVIAQLSVSSEGSVVHLTVESIDGLPVTPQQVLDAAVEAFEHTTFETIDESGLN